MAKVRISGFGSAFELENELVGIGTDNPTNNLQALGNIRSSNAKVVGVSTFTTFDGFIDTKAVISGAGGAKSGSISGEIIIEGSVDVSTGTTFTSGPKNLTVTDSFTLPGVSDDKPSVGSTRFNEHLASLEFYTGVEWRAVNSQVDMTGGGTRGFLSGGIIAPAAFSEITWFNTTTQGEVQYFGQLTDDACPDDSTGNSVRLVNAHGSKAGIVDIIDYVVMATEGNAVDFGNLTQSRCRKPSISSSTRGIWAGGKTPSVVNIIDYVEIMTTGNAIDFGDLNATKMGPMAANSPTRGLIAGGYTSKHTKDMQKITISSKGDGLDFGDMTFTGGYGAACSNQTRALFAGGYDQTNSSKTDTICSVIIASQGSAITFGELTFARAWLWGAATPTRGFFGGGIPTHDVIHYISMQSGGQMVDFGDMTKGAYQTGAITNTHGGLGGF
tara:strand:- start:26 stop:1351 length:1326 start_codon:yes stop_codon:yes gene_type:complete